MRSLCRGRGFTLIELLVVIAIIGILAAMLFPVFARARESARKTQCLANIKNIAIAVNMYLTDYDRFWSKGIDAGLGQYMNSNPGPGGGKNSNGADCSYAWQGNPYEVVPVVLDDYTKNRDIWKCPSAKISHGPIWILGPAKDGGPWWHRLQEEQGNWGQDSQFMLCQSVYPPGWGGDVTDSLAQNELSSTRSNTGGGGNGVFMSGYAMPNELWGMSPSSMQDSASWIVVGEYGIRDHAGWPGELSIFAYPDLCKVTPSQVNAALQGCTCSCGPDWSNCPDSQNCSYDDALKFWRDPSIRKNHTRHLGGSNLGFADGHAKWYPAEAMLATSPDGPLSSQFDDGTAIIGTPHSCLTYWCGTPF